MSRCLKDFLNAPYILTDVQHLAYDSKDLPIWYDVMMLVWFAFTGLLLGMVSLFLRWNSWEILQNPTGMARYSFERLQDPSL